MQWYMNLPLLFLNKKLHIHNTPTSVISHYIKEFVNDASMIKNDFCDGARFLSDPNSTSLLPAN